MEAIITKNERQNGIEVRFAVKPDDTTLAKLHSWGFRWARFNKVWYRHYSDAVMQEVKDYFGQADVKSAKESVQGDGISIIPDAKIHKNSAYLQYIIEHVTGGTEYYMVYDDPLPTKDNEPVSVEHIKSELEDYRTNKYKYSGSYMRYRGDGEFSYSIHSNHHLNFNVEGVTDKIITTDSSLKSYNFYVPIDIDPKGGGFEIRNMEKKAYGLGDRVVFDVWGYRKTGEITKDETYRMRTSTWSYGGERTEDNVEIRYAYTIQADSGIVSSFKSPDQFRLMEHGELPELIPDIMIGKKEYKVWPVVFSTIISEVKNYQYDIKKADAAKKPENVRLWQRNAEITKDKIIQLMTDWYWWENQYSEQAKYVTGETDEQQSMRRMLWSKLVLHETETTLYKETGKIVDKREPYIANNAAEERPNEKTIEITSIEPEKETTTDDFIKQHIIVAKMPPIEEKQRTNEKEKARIEAESMIIILQLEAEAAGWFNETEKMGNGGLFSEF